MKHFIIAIIVSASILFLVAAPSGARTHKPPPNSTGPTDPTYVSALAAADRFLAAWQAGNLAEGMVLLSNGIRHSQNPDRLEQFFSASSDRAFEIRTGRGNADRYTFPVSLVTTHGTRLTRRNSEIVLIQAAKNDWVVDKLP